MLLLFVVNRFFEDESLYILGEILYIF